MLLSLNEQANSRKSRLAKFRENRNLEKETNVEVQVQSNLDQSADGDTQANSTGSRDNSIRSRNFDMETRDAVSGINNPPILALSNNETVEALASQIQQDILQDISQRAEEDSSSKDEGILLEKHESAYHNNDLKADLAYYFNKADTKTNQAINRILQSKYQSSIQ